MLFCSQQFVFFFCAIFLAYWALPSRWTRGGLLLLSGSYFLHTTWSCIPLSSGVAWYERLSDAAAALARAGDGYWIAGIVALGAGLGFVVGHDRARVGLLLAASFFFYASWNKWLALLICVSTALDYLVALGLEKLTSQRWRRLLLLVSLAANLGLLAYFKYANFFLHSVDDALHTLHAHTALPVLHVILPIGISFYTFEAINYTVDVYRRRAPAERNLLHFMLFITFFPHLVAGPIVRARDFLPQIRRPKHWDWVRIQLGAQYLLMGLFKKLVIADRMALYADPVFADPSKFDRGTVWLAVVAYAFQIYCDFSGYTDMALGSAHLLGYKLAQNFNMPYLATNVAEFWHRWHMSLSTWLRDYLFIPLGGSRGGTSPRARWWLTARNLMLTMALGGLWHGAAWTFVVWGMLHGLLLIVHRAFQGFCKPRPKLDGLLQTIPGTVLRMVLTFACVCLTWVFFRSTEFGSAMIMLKQMLIRHGGLKPPLPVNSFFWLAGVIVISHVLASTGAWKRLAVRVPAPVLGCGYAVVAILALVLAPDSGKAFIYFQF
jgi:alginate O-acetyltransferase complex protein AlgI